MAKLLKLRRGTDTQHSTFTGAEGEVTVNTTNDSLHVHDGSTAGGRELARADLSNLPAGTIDNADISSSAAIANSKLATSGVTAGTYGSSSAIPAITVNDRGIVTSATTSAIDSTSIANGTSNVSVAASGDVTATRAGTTRLTVNSTGIDVTGNITVSGTVDGRDVATDGTKLDGIESGATADQTKADIDALNINADQVDGLHAASFLRSDTGDTANGNITFNGGGGAVTVAASSDIRFTTGDWSGETCKLQHHNNYLYMQGGTGGIIFRRSNGSDNAKFDSSGHFQPSSNNTYDLGTSSLRWRNVYTNDLNLSNEGGTNDVDGTWGSWTIQEGEDDLFLLNRRNGKKYKFNLSEVN